MNNRTISLRTYQRITKLLKQYHNPSERPFKTIQRYRENKIHEETVQVPKRFIAEQIDIVLQLCGLITFTDNPKRKGEYENFIFPNETITVPGSKRYRYSVNKEIIQLAKAWSKNFLLEHWGQLTY